MNEQKSLFDNNLFVKNVLIDVLLSILWRWHQIETGSCSRAVLSGIRNYILCSNWMSKQFTRAHTMVETLESNAEH